MSIIVLRIQRYPSRDSTLDLEEVAQKKNIAVTLSFEKMHTEFEDIQERLATYGGKIGY
ncbi:hypothetical protein [Leeuwenhoekiella sp. NPDC079379]|uniref:hypothetical protein n=1 Tax=Leeuwenhoekiella sp. NPDC079379 TaxID=3364122 RepID=UPI0037CB8A7D